MNSDTKKLFENNSASLVKEEEIEIKIPVQNFNVKYHELEDLTVFEKYIVQVIDELNDKIDQNQIASILCIDIKLVEENIKKLIKYKILSSDEKVNWTDELHNWQKKVEKSKKLSLYFTNSDYELFHNIDYKSKEKIIIENMNLANLDIIKIELDEPRYKIDSLNVIVFFDQTTLQLSTVIEHDNRTFYLEKTTSDLKNTYEITNYQFADLSLWEFSENKSDENFTNIHDNYSENFQKDFTNKTLTDSLEIELTPSEYLQTDQQASMRKHLFYDLENPNLIIEHDKYNPSDTFAIKVICNNVMIGHVLKYKNREIINNFCFKENDFQKIKPCCQDGKLYLKRIDNLIECANDPKDEANGISQILQTVEKEIPDWIKRIWDWADENNISKDRLSRKLENLLTTTIIDFTGMKLKNLPHEIFYLEHITTLILWDNYLEYLPQDIVKFTNLTKLNLRGNPNLILSTTQQEWIKNLSKKGSVFMDDIKLTTNNHETMSQESNTNQLVEQIIDTVLKDFMNEYKIDLKTNYQIMIRIKDEAKKVANELSLTGISEFNINYITYINNRPINFKKKFSQDINIGRTIKTDKKNENLNESDFDKSYFTNLKKMKETNNKQSLGTQHENTPYSKYIQGIKNPSFKKNENLNESDFDKSYFTNLKKMKETNNKQSLGTQHELTPYSKYIQSITNPSFEKIRRYCNNLTDENKADEMQKYLAENGKMHKALIYDALEQFITEIDRETLTIVDWGCSQGIASMLLLAYIREKQLDIEVTQVILIEDDTKALGRAMAHNQVFVSKSVEISGFDSKDKTLTTELKSIKGSNIIHIFANDTMPMEFKDVGFENLTNGYFVCISSVNNVFLEQVRSEISALLKIKILSSRDTLIGRFKRFERIYKAI